MHATGFDTVESLRDGASIPAMFGELAADEKRDEQITDILADAHHRGRRTLALANRVEDHERTRAPRARERGSPTV